MAASYGRFSFSIRIGSISHVVGRDIQNRYPTQRHSPQLCDKVWHVSSIIDQTLKNTGSIPSQCRRNDSSIKSTSCSSKILFQKKRAHDSRTAEAYQFLHIKHNFDKTCFHLESKFIAKMICAVDNCLYLWLKQCSSHSSVTDTGLALMDFMQLTYDI